MTEIEKVLMERDGMDELSANNLLNEYRSEFEDIMASGGDYDDVEGLLSDLGLEMDYVFDLMV